MNKDSRHNTLLTQLTAINSEFDARERQLVERITSVEAQLDAANGALIYEVQRVQALEVLVSDNRTAADEVEADLLRQKAELEAILGEVGGPQGEDLRQKTEELDALKLQIEALKREFDDEIFAYQQRVSAERDALLGEMGDQRIKAEAALADLQKVSAQKDAQLREINEQRFAAQKQIDSLRGVASERVEGLQQRIYDLSQVYFEREKALASEVAVARQALVEQLKHQIDIERIHAERDLASLTNLAELQLEKQKLSLELQEIARAKVLTDLAMSETISGLKSEMALLTSTMVQSRESAAAELSDLRHEAAAEKDAVFRAHNHEAEMLRGQIANLTASEAALRARLQEELNTLSHARETLDNAHESIRLIYASRSWRLTAPLRALTSLFLGTRSPGQASRVSIKPAASGLHFNDLAPQAEVPQTINPNSESPSIADPLSTPSTQENVMSSMIKSHTGKGPITVANSLEDLLDSYDRTFVRRAYKVILRREPDPNGMAFFLGRLRQGYTRMSILSAIRLSEESRLIRADLPWLDTAVERHRKEVSRYFGWYYRLKNGSEGNSPSERKLRAIENQVMRVGEESNHRFNMLEVSIEHLNGIVSRQIDSMLHIIAEGGRVAPEMANSMKSASAIEPVRAVESEKTGPSSRAATFSSLLRTAIRRNA